MKTTLAFLAALMLLISCKKEDPATPTPVTPGHMGNYFVLGSTTIELNNDDTAVYWMASDLTYITADAGGRFMNLSIPGNDTGMFHMVGNINPYINVLYINEGYSRPDIWIHVTRYDPVGGRVQGTFQGTFKQNSDTTVVLNASGAFDLTRIPDL